MPAAAARASSRNSARTPRAACGWRSRSAEVVANAKEMLGHTLVTKQTGPAGKQVNRLYIEDGADIDARALSVAAGRPLGRPQSPSSSRPKAAWTSRPSPTTRRRRSSPSPSIRKRASRRPTSKALNGALKLDGAAAKDGGTLFPIALQGLRRQGHEPARGQPADRHEGRPSARARRQGLVRQQRAVPPPRRARTARHHRGGRQGDRGVEVRPRLCRARRQYRLHGQRRRPRHGDDGHHQALRRGAGELPRCRRRRVARKR